MKDPLSIFYYYQGLIGLRKQSEYRDLIREGDYELILKEHPSVFAYKRILEEKEMLVICNFYEALNEIPIKIEDYKLILHNYRQMEYGEGVLRLKPYEALILVK